MEFFAKEFEDTWDGFDHVIAADFVGREVLAVGVGDIDVVGFFEVSAHEFDVGFSDIEIGLDDLFMGFGHAEDEVNGVDHILGEALAMVRGEVDIDAVEGFEGVVVGGVAIDGEDACGEDSDIREWGVFIFYGVFEEHFGHRASAGIAGADEGYGDGLVVF